ncbi:MAG TPA: alkaline phosphatase family protein, partial [Methylomirabilota bacterium]|nr:alkaline phosphatase family protein [Methylomirabilota bacterium]
AEHPLVADWMFEAAPGFCYGDPADGDAEHGPPKYLGTHGQRALYPDNAALFLAAGAGIRRGAALGTIRSRDVAPTVATTLGLRMEAIEGAALDRALD